MRLWCLAHRAASPQAMAVDDDSGVRSGNTGVGAVTAVDGEHLVALLLLATQRGLNLSEQADLAERLFDVVGAVLAESRKPITQAARCGAQRHNASTALRPSSRTRHEHLGDAAVRGGRGVRQAARGRAPRPRG